MSRAIQIMLIATFCAFGTTTSLAVAFGDEPTSEQLIELAPIIDSSDENCQSIDLEGAFRGNESIRFTFSLLYRAPSQYAISIRDGHDETPLLHISNRQCLIYDPAATQLLLLSNSHVNCRLAQVAGELKVEMRLSNKKSSIDGILVNTKSLFDGTTEHGLVKVGEDQIRLTRTSAKGNYLSGSVDLSRHCPFTRLQLLMKEDQRPFASLDKIAINEEIVEQRFDFPQPDRLAEKIEVKVWPDDSAQTTLKGLDAVMYHVMQAAYIRAAARHPELRKSVPRSSLAGEIDWKQVQDQDPKISRVLRESIPAPSQRLMTASKLGTSR